MLVPIVGERRLCFPPRRFSPRSVSVAVDSPPGRDSRLEVELGELSEARRRRGGCLCLRYNT